MGTLGKGIDEMPLGVLHKISCLIFRKCLDPGKAMPIGKRKSAPINPLA